MKNLHDQTAVLVFGRTPEKESRAKFCNDTTALKGTQLARHLLNHTLEVAHQSEYKVLVYNSHRQTGLNFADRLANAIEDAFLQSYDQLIVIGSDCPGISATMINEAGKQMTGTRVILSPAMDGGVNMIAIHKNSYKRSTFIQLDWEKKTLQASWKQYITNMDLEVHWLASMADVDSIKDLIYLVKSGTISGNLLVLLRFVLYSKAIQHIWTYLPSSQVSLHHNGLRAPPAICNYIRPAKGNQVNAL